MSFRIVPITIFGVKFYAVEDQGYTERYCDTREDAERRCEELNDKMTCKKRRMIMNTKHVQLTWKGVVRQIRMVETEEEGVRLLKDFFRKRRSTGGARANPRWTHKKESD